MISNAVGLFTINLSRFMLVFVSKDAHISFRLEDTNSGVIMTKNLLKKMKDE